MVWPFTSSTPKLTYQQTVDELLKSGIVTKAAIFDRVGKPLAHSPDYNVKVEEGAQLANGFDLVNGMKGFDFWLNGQPHFIDAVLGEDKIIGHAKDPSIGREITDKGNLEITKDRSIMANAETVLLAVEFDEKDNAAVQKLVDNFIKNPPTSA